MAIRLIANEAASANTTLSLSATRTTGTAPAQIMFEANITSTETGIDFPLLDTDILWGFDDAGSTHKRLDAALPSLWTDANVDYGHTVTKVFTAAGTYTVTCTVFDGVSEVTDTVQVVIDDFDTEYPSAVHTIGSDPGDDYADFATAYAANKTNAQQKYTFRRGETFTETLTLDTAGPSILQIGAHGTGADPIIDRSGTTDHGVDFGSNLGNCETAIFDVEVKSDYDPTLDPPQATEPSGDGIRMGSADGPTEFQNWIDEVGSLTDWTLAHKTIYNCKITNVGGTCIYFAGAMNLGVASTFMGSWFNFGMLGGDAGYVGLTGISGLQHNDTINGAGRDTTPYYPDHGSFRLSRPWGPTAITKSHFRNRNNWASGTTKDFQPPIRWNAGNGMADAKLNCGVIMSMGGALTLGTVTASGNRRDAFALFDRIVHVDHIHQGISFIHGGASLRNFIWIIPNVRAQNNTGIQTGQPGFDDMPWGDGLTDATSRRCEAYSCLTLDLRNDDNAKNRAQSSSVRPYEGLTTDSAGDRPFTVLNNTGRAPNRTTTFLADDPLDLTATLSFLTYDGERFETDVADTEFAVTAGDHPLWGEPLTGSSAIGGATGKVSLRDFWGDRRDTVLDGLTRSANSTGPFEPDLES